jgi:hypothetical protein
MQDFFGEDTSSPGSPASSRENTETDDLGFHTRGQKSSGEAAADYPAPQRRSTKELILTFLFLAVVYALVFVALFVLLFYNDKSEESFWETIVSKLTAPLGGSAPAQKVYTSPSLGTSISGVVHGLEFSPGKSIYFRSKSTLVFRQGGGSTPDLEVAIVLSPGRSPNPGQIVDTNRASGPEIEEVRVSWKEQGRITPEVATFSGRGECSVVLRFAEVGSDRLSGLVSLNAVDQLGTNFSGSFEASYE